MKAFMFMCTLIYCCFLFSLDKILIDEIHGSRFSYGENMLPEQINYSELFPNYDIHYLNKNSLPITHILWQQQYTENASQTFNFAVPSSPDTLFALYVIAENMTDSLSNFITGVISNSEGDVIAEMCNGVAHVDSASGNTWEISINFNNNDTNQIIIGYGPRLFKSELMPYCPIDLNEYQAMIRVKDNTYFAIMGKTPDYSNSDKEALSYAFYHGLRFLNSINLYESMVDKPFIHFYTDEPIKLDYSVCFPGQPSLAKPKPMKSDKDLIWKNISIIPKSNNEVIYEGALKNNLNFLNFDIKGSTVTIKNLIKYPLYNLKFLKYENNQYYTLTIDEIKAFETIQINSWNTESSKDIKKSWKESLIAEAIDNGLYTEEANHLFSNYIWVESLLGRAYYNPGKLFGIYRFDRNIYNQLIPNQYSIKPEKEVRNLWVMLSNIDNKSNVIPHNLENNLSLNSERSHFEMHEYGVVDEYYLLESEDDDFFKVSLNYEVLDPSFPIQSYPSSLSSFVMNGVSDLDYGFGCYYFLMDNAIDKGLCFININNTEYILGFADTLYQFGGVINIGSSRYFFDEENNIVFIQNCLEALLHHSFFPTSSEPPIISKEKLSVKCYPNPFNPTVTISYFLPQSSYVNLSIYNVKGQLVKNLISEKVIKGNHQITWNGTNSNQNSITNGIYLYTLKTNTGILSGKVLLLK